MEYYLSTPIPPLPEGRGFHGVILMIYDVLLDALVVNFTAEVKMGKGVTRVAFQDDDYNIVIEHSEDQPTVKVISVKENTVQELGNSVPRIRDEDEEFPEECLPALTAALKAVGASKFIWNKKLNLINAFTQDSTEYIYTYEYHKNFNRKKVIKHSKEGFVFIMEPDEITYTTVPFEVWKPVLEQAQRLEMNVGIPSNWLYRTFSSGENKFIYSQLQYQSVF